MEGRDQSGDFVLLFLWRPPFLPPKKHEVTLRGLGSHFSHVGCLRFLSFAPWSVCSIFPTSPGRTLPKLERVQAKETSLAHHTCLDTQQSWKLPTLFQGFPAKTSQRYCFLSDPTDPSSLPSPPIPGTPGQAPTTICMSQHKASLLGLPVELRLEILFEVLRDKSRPAPPGPSEARFLNRCSIDLARKYLEAETRRVRFESKPFPNLVLALLLASKQLRDETLEVLRSKRFLSRPTSPERYRLDVVYINNASPPPLVSPPLGPCRN